VFVALDTSASFEDDADRRTVRIQWDDEPPSVQQWRVSESGKELFAPDGKDVIERMATARRLQFGFTPFNAEPVTAEFAVEGFDRLAGLVTGTCK
jgi:heme-degrading monooxygenase HmoA